MHWCLGDVVSLHGKGDPRRSEGIGDGDTPVIYPDMDPGAQQMFMNQKPGGPEILPTPAGAAGAKNGVKPPAKAGFSPPLGEPPSEPKTPAAAPLEPQPMSDSGCAAHAAARSSGLRSVARRARRLPNAAAVGAGISPAAASAQSRAAAGGRLSAATAARAAADADESAPAGDVSAGRLRSAGEPTAACAAAGSAGRVLSLEPSPEVPPVYSEGSGSGVQGSGFRT